MLYLVLFTLVAVFAIVSLVIGLRDCWPGIVELLNSGARRDELGYNSYAVWPTRLCLGKETIIGAPQVLFRRRLKPFVRKQSGRPAAKSMPKVTRLLRYAAAPERVYVLS